VSFTQGGEKLTVLAARLDDQVGHRCGQPAPTAQG
jgi:hypothetical protein